MHDEVANKFNIARWLVCCLTLGGQYFMQDEVEKKFNNTKTYWNEGGMRRLRQLLFTASRKLRQWLLLKKEWGISGNDFLLPLENWGNDFLLKEEWGVWGIDFLLPLENWGNDFLLKEEWGVWGNDFLLPLENWGNDFLLPLEKYEELDRIDNFST
jgi:hypothetical protein